MSFYLSVIIENIKFFAENVLRTFGNIFNLNVIISSIITLIMLFFIFKNRKIIISYGKKINILNIIKSIFRFIHKYYIMSFIILFILSAVAFSLIYFGHSKKIENRFDKTLKNYEKSMSDIFNNIITNGINENIYTNSLQTNNNQLQNDSVEKLKLSFEVGFKMLESSMNEIMKNSNDILQFWFAFLSIIMIVFTLIGFFISSNILNQAREQLRMVENEAKNSIEKIKIEAKNETNKLIEENNKNIRITSLFILYTQAYNIKDYYLSINYLTKIIKIYEYDFNNNKYDKKLDNYDRAKKNCADAYNIRGSAKDELKLYKEALQDFNKSIELNPNLSDAYNNRGIIKSKLNKYEEAIDDYSEAIKLNPYFAGTYYNIGVSKYNLAKTKKIDTEEYIKLIKDALKYYNKAIGLNDKYVEAYNNRGIIKSKLNKYEEAIDDYSEAIKLNPDFSEAYYNTGVSKYNLTKNKKSHTEEYIKLMNEAIKNYNKAIKLNNNYYEAYYNRGIAKLALNEDGRTIEDFITAYELDDNNDEIKEFSKNQLISLAKQGYEEAIKFCEENDIDYKN